MYDEFVVFSKNVHVSMQLEGTARYAGLLLAPAEGYGLRPRFFLPFGQKGAFYAVFAYFRPFWCLVVTLVTLSGNLGNFGQEKTPKKIQKYLK